MKLDLDTKHRPAYFVNSMNKKAAKVNQKLLESAVQTLFCLFRRLRLGLHSGREFFLSGGKALG